MKIDKIERLLKAINGISEAQNVLCEMMADLGELDKETAESLSQLYQHKFNELDVTKKLITAYFKETVMHGGE